MPAGRSWPGFDRPRQLSGAFAVIAGIQILAAVAFWATMRTISVVYNAAAFCQGSTRQSFFTRTQQRMDTDFIETLQRGIAIVGGLDCSDFVSISLKTHKGRKPCSAALWKRWARFPS